MSLKYNIPNVLHNYFSVYSNIQSYPTRKAEDLHLPYYHPRLGLYSFKITEHQFCGTAVHILLQICPLLSGFKSCMKEKTCVTVNG